MVYPLRVIKGQQITCLYTRNTYIVTANSSRAGWAGNTLWTLRPYGTNFTLRPLRPFGDDFDCACLIAGDDDLNVAVLDNSLHDRCLDDDLGHDV